MDDFAMSQFSDALLLKQMPKKRTGFVLVLNQNKPIFFRLKSKANQIDLVFEDENENK
jgi:hypothetical protein